MRVIFILFFAYLFLFLLSPSYTQGNENPVPVAIMPFDHPPDLESHWVEQIEISFQNEMVEKGKNQFIILERLKIDAILKEQERSVSEAFDEAAAVTVGKLAGARKIILGKIIYADSSHTTITISVRLVDVETGEIIASPHFDDIDLYLGSILYWTSKLTDTICGIDEQEETVVLVPLPEIKLPDIPAADRDATVPIDEYKNLQKKINQNTQSSNFKEALRLLNELYKTLNNDFNNSYFRNNPANRKYLQDFMDWCNNAAKEIKRAFITTEVSRAIKLISDAKADYLTLMRKHISPNDRRAKDIRWKRVIDNISGYTNSEAVFSDPLVRRAYGNVFQIRLVDDLKEIEYERIAQEREKEQRIKREKRRKEEEKRKWDAFWLSLFPKDRSKYPQNGILLGDFFSFKMDYPDLFRFSILTISYIWYNQKTGLGIGIGTSLGFYEFNSFDSILKLSNTGGAFLPVYIYFTFYIYPGKKYNRFDLYLFFGYYWNSPPYIKVGLLNKFNIPISNWFPFSLFLGWKYYYSESNILSQYENKIIYTPYSLFYIGVSISWGLYSEPG